MFDPKVTAQTLSKQTPAEVKALIEAQPPGVLRVEFVAPRPGLSRESPIQKSASQARKRLGTATVGRRPQALLFKTRAPRVCVNLTPTPATLPKASHRGG